jgi:hypothetical protein
MGLWKSLPDWAKGAIAGALIPLVLTGIYAGGGL